MSYPTPWRVVGGDIFDEIGFHVVSSDDPYPLNEIVSRINAGADANARTERAEKALEESEEAMHQRIRATYDKAVADSWKAENERLKTALDEAVGYLKQGKIKFAPTTTNSFVDDFISKWEQKL